MKKQYIIKNKREIDTFFKLKTKKSDSYFTIFLKDDKNNANFRFAMSIGKKFGNAVSRNQIKRRIRAIIRGYKDLIDRSSNFIIVIKPASNTLSFSEISTSVTNLLIKLNIMENKNEKI